VAKKVLRCQKGFTLVEIAVVLGVLAVLVAILVPTVGGFINQSKIVKAQRDLEVVGLAVIRLMQEVGPCIKRNASLPCTEANRVDLLEGEGPSVLSSGVSSADFSSNEISGGSINWDDDGTPASSMEDQFTFNTPVYLTPRDFLLSHPNPANILGWRGSYISSPVGPDPWGNKYFVNTVFSTVASDSAGGINEGQKSGGWSYDLFAISAGPNGVYETPFAQISAVPSGDDIIHIINGSTY